MDQDISVSIATRYGLDGRGIEARWEVKFSAPVYTSPGAQPASYTTGTGYFPGVKRPKRGVDHPSPRSAEVTERLQLQLHSPSGPSSSVPVQTLLLPFTS